MHKFIPFFLAAFALCAPCLHSQSTGQLLWSYDTYIQQATTDPALGEDGTIYFGVGANQAYFCRLFAVNPDGTKRWEFETQASPNCPSIATNGTVYVGTKAGKLFALRPDGTNLWQFTSHLTSPYGDSPAIVSCPAIAADGTIYVAAHIVNNSFNYRRGCVYALNPDGTEKWRFNSTNMFMSPPVIDRDGVVYILMQNYGYAGLLALTPGGVKLWAIPVISGNVLSIDADGIIYAGGFSWVTAVHPWGFTLWDSSVDASCPSLTFTIFGNILTMGDKAYSISRDGFSRLPWSYGSGISLRYDGESHGALVGLDGTVYVGENTSSISFGRFAAFNLQGTQKWLHLGDCAFNISPVMNPKGIVYATTINGKLVAFQGFGGPANTPWPMFQRDARHSGRAYAIPHVPPVLTSVRSATDRGFVYSLTGELGKTYTVQASTNLINWTTVTNVTLTNTPTIHFMDTSATNHQQLSYRTFLN